MTEPLAFSDATTRLGLPFLFAGQAQKEFIVNEALARIDIAIDSRVAGICAAPPADPAAGETWLVGTDATAAFEGYEHHTATWDGSGWIFVPPAEGRRLSGADGVARVWTNGAWQALPRVELPAETEPTTAQLRDAIATLLESLRVAGHISA